MDKLERGILALAAISAITLFHAATNHQPAPPARKPPNPAAVAALPAEVIGAHQDFFGDAKSAFTLVEFADYQCPPCITNAPQVKALVSRYPSKLRFAFRNYPLTTVHLEALPSALAAEAARSQGKFWPMHDALFACKGDLMAERIASLASTLRLDSKAYRRALETTAQAAVDKDRASGKRLAVAGTPTFFLCTPNQRVFRLGELKQAESLLK